MWFCGRVHFFAFVHLLLVDVFFFGSSMSGLGPGFSWRTWNESFKYVWGKFGSVGSPQSFESLSRGMDTQWTPKIASQFFSRFYKLWVRNHLFSLKVFGSSSSWWHAPFSNLQIDGHQLPGIPNVFTTSVPPHFVRNPGVKEDNCVVTSFSTEGFFL